MQLHHPIAIVAAAATVASVAVVPAFAQTNTVSGRETSASAIVAMAEYSPVFRVHRDEQIAIGAEAALPPNLTFPSYYRPSLEAMLRRSALFRRQCLRIAQTPGLVVKLGSHQAPPTGGPRARTEISSGPEGRLFATITIRARDSIVELIAHELEHVIEQLDGVNLKARSVVPGSGVWMCDDGSFETTRAAKIGEAVARQTERVE